MQNENTGRSSPTIHMSLHVAIEVAYELLRSEETERPIPWIYSLLKLGMSAVIS